MNKSDWRNDLFSFIFAVELRYCIIKFFTMLILRWLGFYQTEIISGSLAWKFHRWMGYIPRRSLFSLFQSVAAAGFSWTTCILLHVGIAYYIQYPFQNVNDVLLCLAILLICYVMIDQGSPTGGPRSSSGPRVVIFRTAETF